MTRFIFFLIALLVAIPRPATADIVINGFTDETNDRFTNSSSFIGAAHDFSGLGRGDSFIDPVTGIEDPGQVRWGTLVSRNVVITANHFPAEHRNGTSTISFYRNNDSSNEVVRSIVGGRRIGDSDLYLSVLNAPVPEDIRVYNFADELLSEAPFDQNTNNAIYDAGMAQDELAFMVGISPTARPEGDARFDQAIGQNLITGYIEDFPTNGSDNDLLILRSDLSSDPNFVPFESRFSGGDSGAPLFVVRDNQLVLLGVNSALLSGGGTQFSGVSYVGNHAPEINAFILANAVPEPGSASVLLMLSLFGLAGRRRR